MLARGVSSPSSRKTVNRLIPVFLLLIIFIAYYPAMRGGFIWDDDYYVTENHLLTAPDGLRRIWFTTESPSQYFPLTYTIFFIERRLWNLDPLGYHLVNITIHAINALLVFMVFAALRIRGAWFIAAVFALHPVQVESVAWITELKNVLSGTFYLLALLGYLRFEKSGRWRWYGGALVAFALALLSKSVVLHLPLVLLLLRWWRGGRIRFRDVGLLIPFAAMGAGIGALAWWWEVYHQGTTGEIFDFSLPERLLIAGRALWFYSYKLFLPINLTFSYPRWEINPLALGPYVWHLGVVLVVCILWQLRNRWGRGPLAGVAIFVVSLAPMLGLINYYTMLYSFVADHYQYLASLGIIGVVVGGVLWGFDRWREKADTVTARRLSVTKGLLGGSVLVLLGMLTWHQGYVYSDEETVWQATLKKNPRSWMAYNNLGIIFARRGSYDQALEYYNACLTIKPDHARAYNNRGTVYRKKGMLEEAVTEYRHALAITPAAEFYNNLGLAYLLQGEWQKAVNEFKQAIAINPRYAEPYVHLGEAYQQRGIFEEAVTAFEQACRANPHNAEAYNKLGMVYRKQGRLEEAIAQYRNALAINAGFMEARYNLGNALLQKGEFDGAIVAYEEALAARPDFAEVHYNLSIAYFYRKDYALAILHCDKAAARGYKVDSALMKSLDPYR